MPSTPSDQAPRGRSSASRHPATLAHVCSCDQCAGLVGLALAYLKPGTRVVAHETPGRPRIDLRYVAGWFWVLEGDSLLAATEDEHQALDLADLLVVEALTPEAPLVRLKRGIDGFRVLQGDKEVDRARSPARLRHALKLAEACFPGELWNP